MVGRSVLLFFIFFIFFYLIYGVINLLLLPPTCITTVILQLGPSAKVIRGRTGMSCGLQGGLSFHCFSTWDLKERDHKWSKEVMKLGNIDKAYPSQRPKKVLNLEKEYSGRPVKRRIGSSQYGGTTFYRVALKLVSSSQIRILGCAIYSKISVVVILGIQ